MTRLLLALGFVGLLSTASLASADADVAPRPDSGTGSGGGGCSATPGLGEGAMVFGLFGAIALIAARRR